MKKERENSDLKVESKSAFAARVNLSAARISQYIHKGMPLSSNGKVPVAEALRWIRENVAEKGGRPVGSSNGVGRGGDPGLEAEKTRLTRIQADRAEVELALRKGELVPVEDARRAVRLVAFTCREMMLNFPGKHGADIAGELGVDRGTLIAMLDAHIRKALVKAAEQPMPDFVEGAYPA